MSTENVEVDEDQVPSKLAIRITWHGAGPHPYSWSLMYTFS